jgi:hypothetical protein
VVPAAKTAPSQPRPVLATRLNDDANSRVGAGGVSPSAVNDAISCVTGWLHGLLYSPSFMAGAVRGSFPSTKTNPETAVVLNL